MTLVAERLRVDVIAGADIKVALWAAKQLAEARQTVVEFEYEGIVVRVDADSDIARLEKGWRGAKNLLPVVVGALLPSISPLLTRGTTPEDKAVARAHIPN